MNNEDTLKQNIMNNKGNIYNTRDNAGEPKRDNKVRKIIFELLICLLAAVICVVLLILFNPNPSQISIKDFIIIVIILFGVMILKLLNNKIDEWYLKYKKKNSANNISQTLDSSDETLLLKAFFKRRFGTYLFFSILAITIIFQFIFSFPYIFAIGWTLSILISLIWVIYEEKRLRSHELFRDLDNKTFETLMSEYGKRLGYVVTSKFRDLIIL